MFDKDGSGTISKDEIKEALGGLDEKVVEEIIREVDENADGEISFEEFEKMMGKMVSVTAVTGALS
jgi:Ca2+-binding EF-hand superfamily protein